MSRIPQTTLLLVACLGLAACAQSNGQSSAYGAAPQTYEPPKTVTCTNSGDWGLGWSQDCNNRNGP